MRSLKWPEAFGIAGPMSKALAKDEICDGRMLLSWMTRVDRWTGRGGGAVSGSLQEALSIVRRSLGVMKDVM